MRVEKLELHEQNISVFAEFYDRRQDALEPWPYQGETHRGGDLPDRVIHIRPTVGQMLRLDPKVKTPYNSMPGFVDELREDWHGGDYDDLIARRRGWPEGVRKMLAGIAQIVPDHGYAQRRRPIWAEEGYEVCPDRLLVGHDRPWRDLRPRKGPKNISISVQYGDHCGCSPEQLFWRGGAAVAAIDTLETIGYRAEVRAISCSTNVHTTGAGENCLLITDVEVKNAADPVDLDFLASVLCSPLFFRGNAFTLWYALPWKTAGNLGYAQPIPETMRGDVHVDSLPQSPEEAKELYDEILNKITK